MAPVERADVAATSLVPPVVSGCWRWLGFPRTKHPASFEVTIPVVPVPAISHHGDTHCEDDDDDDDDSKRHGVEYTHEYITHAIRVAICAPHKDRPPSVQDTTQER